MRAEFLQKRLISAFFGFQWQNLAEILCLLPKVLQSENKAVIMITSPSYNICPQQMWLFEPLLTSRGSQLYKWNQHKYMNTLLRCHGSDIAPWNLWKSKIIKSKKILCGHFLINQARIRGLEKCLSIIFSPMISMLFSLISNCSDVKLSHCIQISTSKLSI